VTAIASPHPLSARTAARLSGALFVLCGSLVAIVAAVLPNAPGTNRPVLTAIGLVAAGCGVLVWVLPWDRWPRIATLTLVLPAWLLIALHNTFTRADGFKYSIFFAVTFAWMGLTHRRGTSSAVWPLALVAYLAPLTVVPHVPAAAWSAVYIVPVCVLIGETVAWVTGRLGDTEQELRSGQELWRGLFVESPLPMWIFERPGLAFLDVNAAAIQQYGWTREEFLSMTLLDIRPVEAHAALREATADPAAHQSAIWEHRTKGGTRIDVEVRSCPATGFRAEAYVVVARDVSDERRAADALARQLVHDPLTGLPNRALLLDRLQQSVERRPRVAALLIDIDRFRLVNDQLGPDAADRVLRALAERLADLVGPARTLGRMDGDAFLVICEDGGSAEQVAEDILREVSRPMIIDGRQLTITVSVGLARHAGPMDAADLLREVENALGVAKQAGRNRVVGLDSQARDRAWQRRELERRLPDAVSTGQLVLYFQPIVSLADQRVTGAEALIRWRTPEHGLILPDHFLPIAEELGLLPQIDSWVLLEACRAYARWCGQGNLAAPDHVYVNVTPAQLAQAPFPEFVQSVLAATAVPPDALCLELTEHTLIAEDPGTHATLERLRRIGVGLAVDDFGAGFASFGYLRHLPVTTLKIDRSFVADLPHNPHDVTIVSNIVRLADELGLTAVAEGIETPAQAQALRDLGCANGQGYRWARPTAEPEFVDWLAEWQGDHPHAVRSEHLSSVATVSRLHPRPPEVLRPARPHGSAGRSPA